MKKAGMRQPKELDTHPVNSNVHCDRDGVWGGKDLPVLSWEDPKARVVVPSVLQEAPGVDASVLRWSKTKHQTVQGKHGDTAVDASSLSSWLEAFDHYGKHPDYPEGRWVIFCKDDDDKYRRAIIGNDKNGSLNVISNYRQRPDQVAAYIKRPWVKKRD